MKKCSHCKQTLPESGFGIDQSQKSQLQKQCRQCHNHLCRVWNAANQQSKHNWYLRNKSKHLTYNRIAHRKRLKNNPNYRLRCAIRRRIFMAMRNNSKSSSSLKLLGCSIPEYRVYLENQFKPGMSWGNYGPEWHIDHKLPCASFDLTLPEEQKKCFHYSNTQPLWKAENLSKGDRLTPQPYLNPISTPAISLSC